MRVEPDRLVVIGDGAVVLAFGSVGVAAVAEGCGVVRIEPDRLVVVLDGAVELALVVVSDAAVVEGRGRFWIELDRLVVVDDGTVERVLGCGSDTPVVEGRGEIPSGKFLDRVGTSEDLLVPRDVRIAGAFPSLETLRENRRSHQPER